MPSGEAQRRRTKPEAIAAWFKEAWAAITRRDPKAAAPARRKQRDEDKGGQVMQFPRARRIIPAARGRYGALKVAGKTKGAAKAARIVTPANDADQDAGASAAAYFEDTLAVFYQWNDEALTESFDDPHELPHYYPTLEL